MFGKIISLIENLQKVYPSVTTDDPMRQRITLLEKLSSTANLSGTAMSYIGGGYDSITAFILNPQARTVINVSEGNLFDLPQLSENLPLLQKTFARPTQLTDYDLWVLPCRADTVKIEAAIEEFKRLYIMDGSRLIEIIPCTLINNTLTPDAQGQDLKMIYSNGQTTRTVEIIHSDYSIISAKNKAINEYIRNYPGLNSALVKAPQNLFGQTGSGYLHFHQAHHTLRGTVIQDDHTKRGESFFCNPREILFDERKQFGYGKSVFIGRFSDLLLPRQFYQDRD